MGRKKSIPYGKPPFKRRRREEGLRTTDHGLRTTDWRIIMSAKIIKGENIPVETSFGREKGVIRKEEFQAQGKAQAILQEAYQAAQKIREEASQLKAKVEKELEAAKKRGFLEGRQEGLEALTQELLKIRELKEEFYAGAEPHIMKLVLEIAEKVIGETAQKQTEAMKAIVSQALEKALGDRIVVRLHPDDYIRLKDLEPKFREKLERTKHLHFKEDEVIQKGGCIVESEVGTIDAQLETQLKAI
ncbi:MAG: hypothetical protein HY609_04240 [Deltaproteobacteria bacterium]|nr:hypothetical protein [Deltaproteobacteria bacterium]